jgi:ABC-2 type transport system permease protein
MKLIYLALKDLTQSFRSAFLLAFMFAVPLLITGLFYLMFGGMNTLSSGQASGGETTAFQKARLVLVDLDEGSGPLRLGRLLADHLQGEALASVLEISTRIDPVAARAAVDRGEAAAALIILQDASAAYLGQPAGSVQLELYQDPSQDVAALIVRPVVRQMVDALAALKMAGGEAAADPNAVKQALAASLQDPAAFLSARPPVIPGAGAEVNPNLKIIGPLMAGMMIIFAFFTAVSTAQTILSEDEQGTLARLFTTPTARRTILGGKLLAVGLTVLVQVVVLLVTASLLFQVRWGSLLTTGLAALGIVLCASAFGVFFNSFIKNTKQAGALVGGVVTVTGNVGMLGIFTAGSGASFLSQVAPLLVPQGWALRGLQLSIDGGTLAEASLNLLVMLVLTAVFFTVGAWRFQKRFA